MAKTENGFILALDQGTTSSRSIIFDSQLTLIAIAQKPLNIITPKAGFIEQNANDIWQTQISTAQEVIAKAGLLATDISAIGITNQRETTIIWHKKTGKPVAPAIVWQDRRTHQWCRDWRDKGFDAKIQQITGLRIDPYFSASKIVWLLNQNPKLRQQALAGELAFGTVDSWLLFNMTGEHSIDITNASRTMLMSLQTSDWSDELLDLFDIPKTILPTIKPSDGDFGVTKQGMFGKQIPVTAVLGDQQAALYGQGCNRAGMAKSTYGTGCFLLMNTGDKPCVSHQQLLTTVAWQTTEANHARQPNRHEPSGKLPNLLKPLQNLQRHKKTSVTQTQYALEGSVFMAGAIVQWLRDNLGMIARSEDVETLAAQVPDSQGVTLIPAFTGLGAPYWRADATARLIGLTRGTTKAHIARAALEAIALQAYDVLIAMQKDSPVPLHELRVDGGAANNNILMQFQADILNVPVLRPTTTESTAKGVALLAGQAVGLYDDTSIGESWQLDRIFEPKMAFSERQAIVERWQFYINQLLNEQN
nr:glycerol kinase GlpK [Moraxella osloensis]